MFEYQYFMCADEFEYRLNQKAKEGWRAVNMTTAPGGYAVCLLEREVKENALPTAADRVEFLLNEILIELRNAK